MRPGTFLVDSSHREQRFRVKELLHRGSAHQIALAQDTHLDDKLVCCKTPFADPNLRQEFGARGEALRQELDFLTQGSHLLPEPLDWLEVDSGTELGPVPVLVYEYQHGMTLWELVSTRSPDGLHPLRALMLLEELTRFAANIHAQGYLYRCFDPRHIIVGLDDVIHLVGCGNAVQLKARPNATKFNFNAAYVAPEVRHERSGKTQTPAADVYSLGALLSFMLTGREPLESVESPFGPQAYAMLKEAKPEGLDLVIARCMQPMSKKRFQRADQLRSFLPPEPLPSRKHPDFGLLALPEPGGDPHSRAQRSQLSSGPLISSPRAASPERPISPSARRDAPLLPPERDLAPRQPPPLLAEPREAIAKPERDDEGGVDLKVVLVGMIIIAIIVAGFVGLLVLLNTML